MFRVIYLLVFFSSILLVTASAFVDRRPGYHKHDRSRRASDHYRKPREIRKGFREGRLLYHASEEAHDPRKMLLFHNRPSEPLHDLYRKGFSYLHVPDFHRQPVEERIPRRDGGNQSIDDIISGIIHLLGGDVQVTRPESRPSSVVFPSSPKPARINDRGPAHFDSYSNRRVPSPSTSISSEILPSSTSVIDSGDGASTTNRWVFPDDTDVSLILGLINRTQSDSGGSTSSANATTSRISSTFIGGGSNVSSGHIEVVEIIPSRESGGHYTLPSTSSQDEIIGSSTHSSIQIMPTEVLTELDKNGHTFIETVVTAELINATGTQSSKSEETEKVTKSFITETSVLPSMSGIIVSSTSGTNIFPIVSSDSATEWLPILKPPERGPNATAIYSPHPEEPVIITHQPDSFEITVSRQMYSNQSETKVVPTFTSLQTPADVTSSTDISVSIVATQVDVIYGRPTMSSLPPPPPTGRPQVYPVDIAEIRPSPRPNIYQRPRPPDLGPQKYPNGLRPLPIPRPGAGSIMRKPPQVYRPPPQVPEIRIDTCVVGDDSTCDMQLKEHCRTERGVSSCLCRPGYGRVLERSLCSPVVSMLLTLKVAKLGDKNIDPSHFVPGTPEFQRLNYEASHAVSTIFTYSPLAEAYRGAMVNRIYSIANRMVINSTVHLAESGIRGSLRHHVEHAVASAINRRDNRLGTSQLYVNGPLSALVEVEDVNECGDNNLNDCSEHAVCDNLFGTFQCKCKPGYTDKFEGDPRNAGRICSACSPDYCNGKGQCVVVQGRQECRCRGNYGGSRCQVDNEVIGVSVGVSVIAIIVIAITAACLYLWNRRWKRAHQKSEASKNTAYRLQTMADHVRWGTTTGLSSTYVPSESTLQLAPPQITSSASQLYAIPTMQASRHQQRNQMYDDDANPYGRIIRTLQKHNSLNHSGGLHYDTLNSECASSDDIGFPSVPSNSFVYHGSFPDRSIYR